MLFRIFYIIAFLLLVVNAMHNVTVDDNNPSITYRPPDGWDVSVLDVLDAGGRHHVTADSDASASFTFTGVAIYFYSPLWTFQVTTLVTLDSLSPVLLDLRDYTKPLDIDGPESVKSSVVWSHTGLANTKHTLLVSVGPGQTLAILDTLVYTVLDGNDVSSSTSSSASSTSSTSSSSSTSSTSSLPSESSTPSSNSSTASSNSSSKGLAVTLGVVCTVFGFLVITGIWWCIRRRRRRDDDYYDYPRTFNNNDNNNSPQMSNTNINNTNNAPVAYNYSSRSTSFPRGRDSRSRSRSTIIPTAQISARRKKNNLTNSTSRPSSSSTSSSSSSSTTNRHYSTISHSSSSKMLKNNPLTPIPEALRETSLARSTMTYL